MEDISITPELNAKGYYEPKYYEYDTRIDEENWYLIFFGTMLFYFIVQALGRKLAPVPGDVKVFKEKKRMKDYHFYYF